MNKSVSKLLVLPCRTVDILSRPIPVSIDGFGRDSLFLFESCKYCIKTRFHISTNLSPSSFFEPGGPPSTESPWSKKISEHGPQGPSSPIDQKLSSVEILIILLSENPETFFHISSASVSSLNTVRSNLLDGISNSFTNKSQASFIASSLK